MKFKNYIVLFLSVFAIIAVVKIACIISTYHDAKDFPFWDNNTYSISKRFELAKQSEPELVMFLRRMPKGADIHNHAGIGAVYSDFILDYACKHKLNYDLTSNEFTTLPERQGVIISSDSIIDRPDYLYQFLNKFSMRGWMYGSMDGHDHFFNAFSGIESSEYPVDKMLLEVIKRNKYENVQYLEVMMPCIPSKVFKKFKAALTEFDIHDLDKAYGKLRKISNDPEVIKEIRAYLNQRDNYLNKELELTDSITGNNGDLVIRYISSLNREVSLSDFFVSAVGNITAFNIDDRIVGLNVVGPEDFPNARNNFDDQMKILDFLWNKMGHPKFTLHAGELTLKYSPLEVMKNRISKSIKLGHALRIGHGVSIAWEDDPIGLLN